MLFSCFKLRRVCATSSIYEWQLTHYLALGKYLYGFWFFLIPRLFHIIHFYVFKYRHYRFNYEYECEISKWIWITNMLFNLRKIDYNFLKFCWIVGSSNTTVTQKVDCRLSLMIKSIIIISKRHKSKFYRKPWNP